MSAMYRNQPVANRRNATRATQRGFAIVSAIFLLLLLAALGAFMITMSMVQHASSAQDVQGSRAYQAARAGIEWGVYQAMFPENTNPTTGTAFTTQYNCENMPYTFAPVTPDAPTALGGTLSGFTVTVTCVRDQADEGGNRISTYQLVSTARAGAVGSANYVERQLTATVGTCRKADNDANCS